MMDHAYTFAEILVGTIGVLLTGAFAAWAAVVKRAADAMQESVNKAVDEISRLRQEIHQDRVVSERRFTRLEHAVGLREPHDI